jgi:hypothetical protein
MKEIKLTQGKVALVDDEDFEYLNQWKWHAHKDRLNYWYAIRTVSGKRIPMHRQIMNTPKDRQVDHIDHNGLNNQRSNLRNCTRSQNQMNRKAFGKSKYIGVNFKSNKIVAQIHVHGKKYHLGYFNTEEAAAIARDIASKKYYGEFANLNFK